MNTTPYPIMSLSPATDSEPLKYVPHAEFPLWADNPRLESGGPGPMPEARMGIARPPASGCRLPGKSLQCADLDPRTGNAPLPQAELPEVQGQPAAAIAGRRPTRPIDDGEANLADSWARSWPRGIRSISPTSAWWCGSPNATSAGPGLLRADQRRKPHADSGRRHFDFSLGNRFSTYVTCAISTAFPHSIPEGLRWQNRHRTDRAELFSTTVGRAERSLCPGGRALPSRQCSWTAAHAAGSTAASGRSSAAASRWAAPRNGHDLWRRWAGAWALATPALSTGRPGDGKNCARPWVRSA